MSGAAEIGSVQILCYAQRGERSVQTGGASVQIYAPPHYALVMVCLRVWYYYSYIGVGMIFDCRRFIPAPINALFKYLLCMILMH